jgi:anti-sigma factor RsiW
VRCEEAREKFSQYIEGSLSGDEIQAFEEHVRDCKSCRMELEHARDMDTLLRREVPEYWREIEPAPAFLSRLEKSGLWAAPRRTFSLKEWLFTPRQSPRVVTVALSTALVVALALLVPQAFIPQGAPPAAPTPVAERAASLGEEGMKFGAEAMPTPVPAAVPTPVPTSAPTPAPAAVAPPSATPTPTPRVVFSESRSGSFKSEPFVVRSAPWKLQWSATLDVPGRIVIRVVDAQTEIELGEVTSSFTSPGKIDNETLFYNKKGKLYLSVNAADSTKWKVEVTERP